MSKAAQVKQLALDGSVEAVEILCEIMRNPGEQTTHRINAAKAVLERALGRPAQEILHVQQGDTQRPLEGLTLDEVRRLAQRALLESN